jgi:hypothetical protein
MKMKEVYIPLDIVNEAERAELEVKDSGHTGIRRYRLESVDLSGENDPAGRASDRFTKLKHFISNYDPNWQLIQILDSGEDAKYIHLLYREIT